MAMLRHRAAAGSRVPARLLASWRSAGDIIHRDELARLAAAGDGLAVAHALTRSRPAGWTGYGRRIDAAMLGEFGFPPGERPRVFVCGPTALVEAAAAALVALGHPPARVKTERFGTKRRVAWRRMRTRRAVGRQRRRRAAARGLRGRDDGATAVCEGCGREAAVAELTLYGGALGAVLRCPGCDLAMIRLAATPAGHRLDMRGVALLRIARAA
jgi:hypothetical protein